MEPPYLPPLLDPLSPTLVLDLDETLVHYKENLGGEDHELLVWPGVDEFLQ